MAMSTSVRLPKDVLPTYPDRCIYSNAPGPDAEALVIANSQSPFVAFLSPLLLFFGWRRVRVPISRPYLARFYIQNFGRDIITIALVFLGLLVFMPMIGKDDPLRKFKVAALVLAALSPLVLFEVFLPRRFDVTARKDWIDYEFASAEYAKEFAMINARHVIQIE